MSAPEWAVEKAYRARVEAKVGRALHDAEYEAVRSSAEVEWMRAALDAVWPETTTEWGVRFEDGFVKSWRGNEQAARRHEREVRSQSDDPGVLVAREVGATEWREVTP